MARFFSTIIIIVVIGILTRYLGKQSERSLDVGAHGEKTLRYPKVYEVIGWVVLVFSGLLIIASILDSQSLGDEVGIMGISVLFAVSAVPFILLRRNTEVIFDDEKIIFQNLFRSRKLMPWANIKHVDFNPLSKNLTLRDDNQKIIISYSMVGFQNFLDVAKKEINPSVLGDTLEKIDKFYQRL